MTEGLATEDREKLKIASFRTKEGVWADFIAAAAKVDLTGTDVLRAAMDDFMTGEYMPRVKAGIHTTISTPSMTKQEIQALIDAALEQRPPMDMGYVLNQLRGLAERVDTIEQTLATVSTRPPTAPQAKEPGELGDEDRKWVKRFEAEPELQEAAAGAIAQGGTSKEIADRLLEAGHGNTKGAAFDATVVSRMKKAIAHLESSG
jgi:hypothetical protein